ncbi:unnamed protein product, partial [Discosporangium mesarthrocarpum]
LEARLEASVQGQSRWFEQRAWAEALELREQSMGPQILSTVGYVYRNYGHRTLGKLAEAGEGRGGGGVGDLSSIPQAIRGRLGYMSDRGHRLTNLLSAASSTTRLYLHLQTR